MNQEVNISEFYKPKPKYMVYMHHSCRYFWIQKGFSIWEPSPCPNCFQMVDEAVAAYPTIEEAQEHHKYLLHSTNNENWELKIAKELNRRIDEIEAMKPKEKVFYNGVEVKSFLDGSFYKRWLNWNDIAWPNAEVMGCNKWKNFVQHENFGPRINEKKPKCEANISDMFMNISVWAQR